MVLEATGWYSYDEFVDVFSRLLKPEEYPYIARKIALWHSKSKIPAAIVATESLINVIIADQKGCLSEYGLRNLYAMAVIRAVNLLLDHEQDREYARSLKMIAKECEFPEHVITVRHECSHREIPDLNTLRFTALDAMNYVYKKYWTAQYKALMYKLRNEEYDALSLSCLLMGCHSTALFHLPCSLEQYRWRQFHSARKRAIPATQTKGLTSLLRNAQRALKVRAGRINLSSSRRRPPHAENNFGDPNTVNIYNLYIKQVGLLSKRLIEGCLREEFFISALVEFVFPRFDPSPNCLYVILLLESIARLPFNFTVRLVSAILRLVFDLGRKKTAFGNNIDNDYTSTFSKYLSTAGAAYIQKRLGGKSATSHLIDVDRCTARRRANRWLLLLLEWGVHFQDRIAPPAPLYAMVVACTPGESNHRLWSTFGDALTRLCRAAYLILPHCVHHISARNMSRELLDTLNNQPWERDQTSHALGLYTWLRDFLHCGKRSRYRFATLSESDRRNLLHQIKQACLYKPSMVDHLLLPGTLWDPDLWSVKYTVPRISEHSSPCFKILEKLPNMVASVTVKMSNKAVRRYGRLGRRIPQSSGAIAGDNRAFLHIIAQVNASSKHLCHRERFS